MSGVAEPDGAASTERTRALGRVSTYTYEGRVTRPAPKPSAERVRGPRRVEVTIYRYSQEPGVGSVCLGTRYYWELDGRRIAEGPDLPADWQARLTHDAGRPHSAPGGRSDDEEADNDERGPDGSEG